MNCNLCAGLGFLREQHPVGHPSFGQLVPCRCREDELQKKVAAQCGLLDHELAITLDSINLDVAGPGTRTMVAMARKFQAAPWGMWTIWGTYGNAKTMCLQALVNHFRANGRHAVYCRFKDLLDWIKAGNKPGAAQDAQDRYRRMVEVEVLAIDELEKFYVTDYAEEFFLTFIDDRWRYGVAKTRHTIIATNKNPESLPGSIYDRLRDDRFGCEYGGRWLPGITYNADQSMRPVARELEGR